MKLTREQRKAFFDGRYPRLAGEGVCPVGKGYKHRLSSRLSFEVTLVRKTRVGGWSLEYTVFNQRLDADHYLRPIASPMPVDDRGNPLPMGEAEEHGYTSNPKSRMAERAPVVPRDYQNVLVVEARERFMRHQRDNESEREAEKDLQAVQAEVRELVKRAVKMGVNPAVVIAPIAREIQAQHAQIQKAA